MRQEPIKERLCAEVFGGHIPYRPCLLSRNVQTYSCWRCGQMIIVERGATCDTRGTQKKRGTVKGVKG